MVGHRRAPGVEHGGDADAGAEVLRVGRDRQHRLRRRPEQQVVDERLVLEGDVGDLGGQREDDMEVADRQQVGLALGQPGRARRRPGTWGSAGCGSCCRRSASGRSPRRPRRDRQAPRCGSVSIADMTLSWAGSGARHGRPDRPGPAARKMSATSIEARTGSAAGILALPSTAPSWSSGLVTARIVRVATLV